MATDFEQKMASASGTAGRDQRPADQESAGEREYRPRKASALGVTAVQVEDALYTAYGQRQISTIYAPNDEYWVIMELEDQYQRDPIRAFAALYPLEHGQLVPLNAVASLTTSLGPLTVNHLGQLPAVTISFNLKPGIAIGDAVNESQRSGAVAAADDHGAVPGHRAGISVFADGLGILLLMAILVIYIVLGILYESFIHPITILSGLPSAAFGALLTLQIFGYEPRPLRIRRRDHADRHREEERHHDDGFRHRARTRRAYDSAPKRSTRAAWCASGRS